MKKVIIILLALVVIAWGTKWFFSVPPIPEIKRYNILYLTADSFNKKHLPMYGYHRNTTPFLADLATRSVVFDRMINPSGWTNENLVSIFSGWSSAVHKVETRGRNIDPAWTTPLDILKAYGYAIPRLQGWQSDQNHEKLGFDTVTIMHPAEWLEAHGTEGPFFLFYQFLQPHLPYDGYGRDTELFRTYFADTLFPNAASRKRIHDTVRTNYMIPRDGTIVFDEGDIPAIHALYDGELLLFDSDVKHTVETLDRLGLLENTIIIIGADHGEELMEHGHVGHASTSKNGTLYEEIVNIPFMIYFPKELPMGAFIKTQVRGIDVMPTVLDLLGLVPRYFEGKSLLPVIRGEEIEDRNAFVQTSRRGYNEPDPDHVTDRIRAVADGTWKLIHYFFKENQGRFELYNLKDDPLEKMNLVDSEPARAEKLKELLFQWISEEAKIKPQSILGFDVRLSPFQRLKRYLFPPKKIDLTGVPSPPEVISPKKGDVFTGRSDEGRAAFRWTGRSDVPYIIEYNVGDGTYHLEGFIEVEGNERVYGPFQIDYWNTYLTKYSPYRVRVSIDKEPREWSEWIEFKVEETK